MKFVPGQFIYTLYMSLIIIEIQEKFLFYIIIITYWLLLFKPIYLILATFYLNRLKMKYLLFLQYLNS